MAAQIDKLVRALRTGHASPSADSRPPLLMLVADVIAWGLDAPIGGWGGAGEPKGCR